VVVKSALVVTVLACAVGAAAVTAGQSPAERDASIWDAVYSEAQAQRGEAIYASTCGTCHGYKLNGAPDDPDMISTPPIAGQKFLRDWDGRSLATLYAYTRTTMPTNNPGFLTDAEYADLLAYMLSVSGAPAGEEDLPSDPGRLTGIVIRQQR
jgi:mono/diheme cytochrome c family protein